MTIAIPRNYTFRRGICGKFLDPLYHLLYLFRLIICIFVVSIVFRFFPYFLSIISAVLLFCDLSLSRLCLPLNLWLPFLLLFSLSSLSLFFLFPPSIRFFFICICISRKGLILPCQLPPSIAQSRFQTRWWIQVTRLMLWKLRSKMNSPVAQ